MSFHPEGFFVVGNKLYATCKDCGKMVQVNKLFFGSLHICRTEEEIKNKEKK